MKDIYRNKIIFLNNYLKRNNLLKIIKNAAINRRYITGYTASETPPVANEEYPVGQLEFGHAEKSVKINGKNGAVYGPGIYCIYNLDVVKKARGMPLADPEYNGPNYVRGKSYGDHVYSLATSTHKVLSFNADEAFIMHDIDKSLGIKDRIIEQLRLFGASLSDIIKAKSLMSELDDDIPLGNFNGRYCQALLPLITKDLNLCRGVIFYGAHDGHVFVLYDYQDYIFTGYAKKKSIPVKKSLQSLTEEEKTSPGNYFVDPDTEETFLSPGTISVFSDSNPELSKDKFIKNMLFIKPNDEKYESFSLTNNKKEVPRLNEQMKFLDRNIAQKIKNYEPVVKSSNLSQADYKRYIVASINSGHGILYDLNYNYLKALDDIITNSDSGFLKSLNRSILRQYNNSSYSSWRVFLTIGIKRDDELGELARKISKSVFPERVISGFFHESARSESGIYSSEVYKFSEGLHDEVISDSIKNYEENLHKSKEDKEQHAEFNENYLKEFEGILKYIEHYNENIEKFYQNNSFNISFEKQEVLNYVKRFFKESYKEYFKRYSYYASIGKQRHLDINYLIENDIFSKDELKEFFFSHIKSSENILDAEDYAAKDLGYDNVHHYIISLPKDKFESIIDPIIDAGGFKGNLDLSRLDYYYSMNKENAMILIDHIVSSGKHFLKRYRERASNEDLNYIVDSLEAKSLQEFIKLITEDFSAKEAFDEVEKFKGNYAETLKSTVSAQQLIGKIRDFDEEIWNLFLQKEDSGSSDFTWEDFLVSYVSIDSLHKIIFKICNESFGSESLYRKLAIKMTRGASDSQIQELDKIGVIHANSGKLIENEKRVDGESYYGVKEYLDAVNSGCSGIKSLKSKIYSSNNDKEKSFDVDNTKEKSLDVDVASNVAQENTESEEIKALSYKSINSKNFVKIAKKIFSKNNISDIDIETLIYIRNNYNLTEDAAKVFDEKLKKIIYSKNKGAVNFTKN